jgi:hypothetical protein
MLDTINIKKTKRKKTEQTRTQIVLKKERKKEK